MKLFTPDLQIEDEDFVETISLEELTAFPFENYTRGLQTAFEHIEQLARIQLIGNKHPISSATRDLVNITVESYHEYYGLKYEGIALESLQISMEKEENGFLHGVGIILKAIWTAISNLFKNIWNFFKKLFGFSKEKKKKLKKKKDQVEEIQKEAEKVVKNPPDKKEFEFLNKEPDHPLHKYKDTIYDSVDTIIQYLDSLKSNNPIELMDNNVLSYLLNKEESTIETSHIQLSVDNAREGLKRYSEVMSIITQNFDKAIGSSQSLNNVRIIDDQTKLLTPMFDDFEKFFDSFFGKLHPVVEQAEFRKGYKELNQTTQYKITPNLSNVGYVECPYYGEQHYFFKQVEEYRQFNSTIMVYDAFVTRCESKSCQVRYVPFKDAKTLIDDTYDIYELFDEQNNRNQTRFSKFERAVDKWSKGVETIINHFIEIYQKAIDEKNFIIQQGIRNAFGPYGNMDVHGNTTNQASNELQFYQSQQNLMRLIIQIYRNYSMFIMKILKNYTDYLVKMNKYFHFLEQTVGSTIDYFYKESSNFTHPEQLGLSAYVSRSRHSNR